MRLLDEHYTKTPFSGVKRMTAWLQRAGEEVNEKRIRRLLRTMGLLAIYPGPKTSQPDPEHRIYPYLLRGMAITRPNVVWSTDITYIRLDSCSWWRSSIGTAGMCWPGNSPIRWRRHFVWKHSSVPCAKGHPPFLTPIKGRNSPAGPLRIGSWSGAYASVWMDGDGLWTTSLWNASGARSNGNTSICTITRPWPTPGTAYRAISSSTTMSVRINLWPIDHQPRSISHRRLLDPLVNCPFVVLTMGSISNSI